VATPLNRSECSPTSRTRCTAALDDTRSFRSQTQLSGTFPLHFLFAVLRPPCAQELVIHRTPLCMCHGDVGQRASPFATSGALADGVVEVPGSVEPPARCLLVYSNPAPLAICHDLLVIVISGGIPLAQCECCLKTARGPLHTVLQSQKSTAGSAEYGLCIAASYYAACGKRGTVNHLSKKSSSLFNTQLTGTPRQFERTRRSFLTWWTA
jgi:hypothetical protein